VSPRRIPRWEEMYGWHVDLAYNAIRAANYDETDLQLSHAKLVLAILDQKYKFPPEVQTSLETWDEPIRDLYDRYFGRGRYEEAATLAEWYERWLAAMYEELRLEE